MNYGKTKSITPSEDEGEITQCLTDASDRESNVNALKGKSPGSSGFVHLLTPIYRGNGINEQTFSSMKEDGITVARQPMILTWFLINSRKGNPQRLDVFNKQRT